MIRSRPAARPPAVALALAAALACAHPPGAPPRPQAGTAGSGGRPAPDAALADPPLTASAGPAAATPAAPPPPDLGRVRAGADAVLRAQAEAYWSLFTVGEPAEPAAAWKGHEALLADATLADLSRAAATFAGDDRRGAALLRRWFLGERLARAAAGAGQAAARAREKARVSWGGRTAPLRELPQLLAAEHDRDHRRALAEAAAAAAREWLERVAAREARVVAASRELGFPDAAALAGELRGADPAALGALADGVLARTDGPWRALLAERARREGLAVEEVRARDLPRLLRSTLPASTFPAGRALDAGAQLLAGLGIDVAAQRNLRLDPGPRAGKLPAAIALPVDPPGDVRLSAAPLAGVEALRAVLHELGVAEAFAHVGEGPPELRRLGSPALSETWGILLEEVAGAPAWLAERGVAPDAARVEARVAAARRLLRVREDAARVLVALARAGDPAGAAARTAAIAARAWGFPAEAADLPPWRTDPDPLLRSAESLRAELLAAQAEAFLSHAAGRAEWWRSPQAGAWLVKAWADGGRRTPEELSLALGQPGLDAAALEQAVRARTP